jgi:hypothetical protein
MQIAIFADPGGYMTGNGIHLSALGIAVWLYDPVTMHGGTGAPFFQAYENDVQTTSTLLCSMSILYGFEALCCTMKIAQSHFGWSLPP